MKIVFEHWVSPRFKKSELTFPLSLDKMIDIFEDRVQGWQIIIADQAYRGVLDSKKKRVSSGIPHSGFAVLLILLSYFEMVAKFEAGDTSKDSGVWFKAGIKSVYPELSSKIEQDKVMILARFYKGARCGLYHAAMTSKQVFVSGDVSTFDYDASNGKLIINPGDMIDRISSHFEAYIQRLRDLKQTTLRANFERKFKKDILPQFK